MMTCEISQGGRDMGRIPEGGRVFAMVTCEIPQGGVRMDGRIPEG